MSEGWGKVTTSSWWLEQAGVGQKAVLWLGPRERKQLMMGGNHPEDEMSYVDGRHGKF